MDLAEELAKIVGALERAGIDYAVVGAFALAVHGVVRATTDIDLLIRSDDVDRSLSAVRPLGYALEAEPMRFSDGMEVRRVSKVAGLELLTLDFLIVNDNIEPIWQSRASYESSLGTLRVISREALIKMKVWAGRSRDASDIERLRELDR